MHIAANAMISLIFMANNPLNVFSMSFFFFIIFTCKLVFFFASFLSFFLNRKVKPHLSLDQCYFLRPFYFRKLKDSTKRNHLVKGNIIKMLISDSAVGMALLVLSESCEIKN